MTHNKISIFFARHPKTDSGKHSPWRRKTNRTERKYERGLFFSLISSPISCSLGFPVSSFRTGISPFLCVPHSSSSRSEFLDGYVSLLGGSFIFILDPPRRKPSCRRPPRREPWIHAHCSEKVLRNSWSRENVLSLSLSNLQRDRKREKSETLLCCSVCMRGLFCPLSLSHASVSFLGVAQILWLSPWGLVDFGTTDEDPIL